MVASRLRCKRCKARRTHSLTSISAKEQHKNSSSSNTLVRSTQMNDKNWKRYDFYTIWPEPFQYFRFSTLRHFWRPWSQWDGHSGMLLGHSSIAEDHTGCSGILSWDVVNATEYVLGTFRALWGCSEDAQRTFWGHCGFSERPDSVPWSIPEHSQSILNVLTASSVRTH